MGGKPATTGVSLREHEEHSWLEAVKYTWGIPLMLLLFAIVAAISPMLLWLYVWDRAHLPASGNATAGGTNSRKRHDYARGYAQGVENITSYRRGAEEAEREVERLRKELRDSQQPRPSAGK